MQYISIIICALVLLSCQSSETAQSNNAVINKLIRYHTSEKIEDVFIATDTIRFEFTEKSIMGTITKICHHPLGFLTLDTHYSKNVQLFDHHGKYLKTLGLHGQGPGEYLRLQDIAVDNDGHSIILDFGTNKILIFDREGIHLGDIQLGVLNIRPQSLHVLNELNDICLFDANALDNNFQVVNFLGNRIKVKKAFGCREIDKKSFTIPITGFGVSAGEIWEGSGFELDIKIFISQGILKKTIKSHKNMLPGPHIHYDYFKSFNRLSEALDTYYQYTRFGKFVILKDFIMACFYGPQGKPNNYYYMLFSSGGKCLNMLLKDDGSNTIVGTSGNTLYKLLKIENNKTEVAANPGIVRLSLREEH